MAPKLSDVLMEAAHKATQAIFLRGKAQAAAVEEIRTLMSEAQDLGLYHRDDNVDVIELTLDQPKLTTGDARELQKRLNVLVRCAEWVEAVTHKAEENAAMDDGPDPY